MPAPDVLVRAVGTWRGRSRLNLPWLSPEEQITESDSDLRVETGPRDAYAFLSYTWRYDGEDHAGHLLVTQGKRDTTMGWSDSWHQNSSVLCMSGLIDEAAVRCTAVYSTEAHGRQWSWRIELEATGPEEFTLRMVNIHPDGQEDWAVDAVYTPADKPGEH